MATKLELFINGEWNEGSGSKTIEVINPATKEVAADLCMAEVSDLEAALDAVEKGFVVWRNTPADQRASHLHKTASLMRDRVDEMSRKLTREQGKTLSQAKWEIIATANYFDDLAECGQRLAGRILPHELSGVSRSIVYEPIGPVFAASPWNLPAMMPGRKIATTLAAGCSVIIKPAKETPETAYMIAQCCHDAGIPNGVVNVVSGESSMISENLISSDIIRKISFTGSTDVGKHLAQLAGANMKKMTMELGGHAPVIVCEDIDVNKIVEMIVPSRYSNAGQSCMAATRFYVHDKIYEQFVESYAERTKKIRTGNGMDEDTDMGPLISERRLGEMERLVQNAVDNGAELLCGGNRIPGEGYFYEPTVLAGVNDRATIMHEEPFGPITPITSYTDLDEVIARANGTPYGLASYIFCADIGKANYIASSLDAGLVGINSMNVAGPAVPFGGVKDSGVGREGTVEGILESMTTKTISAAYWFGGAQ